MSAGVQGLDPVAFPEHADAGPDASGAHKGARDAYFEPSGFVATQIYDGAALHAGNVIDGPAIIERMGDSVVVPPAFRAEVDRLLTIRLGPIPAPGA